MTTTIPMASGARAVESHDLGPLERIPPGEGRAFIIDSRSIAVFRTRTGEVFAAEAECPHAGGPLADGLIGGRRLVCPLHGRTFDLLTGRELRDSCPALRTYPVSCSDAGHILVNLDAPQP